MAETQIKKVLLVDDVEFITDVMSGYLKRSPVETVTASNGKQAIDQALLHWPDLIIMDVSMPEMGGEEACRTLKQHPKLKDTPILLIFDPERDPSADKLKKCGCDDLIEKPIARENFLTTTHRHLFHLRGHPRRRGLWGRRMPLSMSVSGPKPRSVLVSSVVLLSTIRCRRIGARPAKAVCPGLLRSYISAGRRRMRNAKYRFFIGDSPLNIP